MPDNEIILVEEAAPLGADYAVLEFTFQGEQGLVNGPVRYDLPDDALIQMAQEALRSGDVTGITTNETADLDGFKVERYNAKDGLSNRISIRPKTAFGSTSS